MTFICSLEHGAVCTVLWFLPVLGAGSTPVPTYGTYFGGAADTNVAVAVAVDPSGNIVVAGYTTSQTLPGTAKVFQPTKTTGFPDNQDVFIAKFNPLPGTPNALALNNGDADIVGSLITMTLRLRRRQPGARAL